MLRGIKRCACRPAVRRSRAQSDDAAIAARFWSRPTGSSILPIYARRVYRQVQVRPVREVILLDGEKGSQSMPRFTAMDPNEVRLGNARRAAEAKRPYVDALLQADAGKVEVERGEKPGTVKRYLAEAAREVGVRVRSSWEDPKQPRVLFWRKVNGKRRE